jgi:ribosome-associated protein YbcJ (S4-like RNA binding protein)
MEHLIETIEIEELIIELCGFLNEPQEEIAKQILRSKKVIRDCKRDIRKGKF